MRYSIKATFYCDPCGAQGLGDLVVRKLPGRPEVTALLHPDDWGTTNAKAPRIAPPSPLAFGLIGQPAAPARTQPVNAMMPAPEIAAALGADVRVFVCKKCLAKLAPPPAAAGES